MVLGRTKGPEVLMVLLQGFVELVGIEGVHSLCLEVVCFLGLSLCCSGYYRMEDPTYSLWGL